MTAPMAEFERRTLARFRRALVRWYRRNARPLPWRRTSDPYRIWISEIMLQQTTVAAVVPYFERFLKKFPTLAALAAAPEGAVLRSWEGLGYYSRARNIHKAARQMGLSGFRESAATRLARLLRSHSIVARPSSKRIRCGCTVDCWDIAVTRGAPPGRSCCGILPTRWYPKKSQASSTRH
jgi:hypothetical protein